MIPPLFFRSARLIDPATGVDSTGNLLVEGGRITALGADIGAPHGCEVVQAEGAVLAPGLVDLRVKTGEPGHEHKETLATASEAAAAGGVTSFVCMPDTSPAIDTVALVDFIIRRAGGEAKVRVYPAGGLTAGLAGVQMTEIGLMHEAGAVMFTNGDQAVADAGVLRRAMQYAGAFDALIAARADTHALTRGAIMNSGAFAGRLGLRGAPPEAEWIAIERDLMLAEATGARVLIDTVSTARGLASAVAARRRGVRACIAVAAYSLFFNEIDIGDYLTYCKVFPPFRTEADRQALIEGLVRGEIDAVVSAHDPQPPENKRLPIAEAAYGAVGLETLLPALLSVASEAGTPLVTALRPVTSGPADLLGLPQGRLAPGAPGDLVLFDPEAPWACRREDLHSRSKNSPFDGRRLFGRVLRTVVAGRTVFARR